MNRVILWVSLILFIYAGSGLLSRASLDSKIIFQNQKDNSVGTQVIYQGVSFNSLNDVIELKKRESIAVFFPWVFWVPMNSSIILVAFCFGSLGTIFRIFKHIALDNIGIDQIKVIYLIPLGGLLGIMIYGISYIMPAALTVSKNTIQPNSIFILSLIGGLFCENTMKWAEKIHGKIFLTKGRKDEKVK